MAAEKIRLTRFSGAHANGGRIAPDVLEELLGSAPAFLPPQLLAGSLTGEEAAVYQINAQQAIVASTDFFTPMVDDPYDFGRIAATQAISDIYAVGGTPLFALALVGMPGEGLSADVLAKILEGGEAICRAAAIPVAGRHIIDSVEPIYGLVAIGLVNPAHLKTAGQAIPGDKLILGKQLGVGIYSAALKQDILHESDYDSLVDSATQLNTPGPLLACLDGVHVLSDVTGDGLLGHLVKLSRASQVRATVQIDNLPLLARAREIAKAGHVSAEARRNAERYGSELTLAERLGPSDQALLVDPQTSGGLLVACAPDTVTEVLSIFLQQGFTHVSVIGEVSDGAVGVSVV